MAKSPGEPVKVFCVYHEEDGAFHASLRNHLASLIHRGLIEYSDSGSVPAGSSPLQFYREKMAGTQVLVLLVSPDLIAAEIWWHFWSPLVNGLDKEPWTLVPVRIRSVELANDPLANCQLLPRGSGVPVRACPDQDAAWSEIAREIGDTVRTIAARPKASLEEVKDSREHAYRLKYQGRGKEALEQLRGALVNLDDLSRREPANVSLTRERAHLHDRIAQCEYAHGRFDEAQRSFDFAYEVRVRLRDSDPDDIEGLFDLSTSHFWRGYLAHLCGDLGRAREEQLAGMEACRAIRHHQEDHLQAARSLVVLETDLGTTLQEMRDGKGAEEHLRSALALARKLAKQNPGNLQIERDVSVGLFRLADLLVQLGQTAEATEACEESIERCWALAGRAPTNVQWRRHLATARISMGDVRLSHDDLARARGDYEFATGTMGALAALELEDVQGTRHYARAEKKLGDLLFRAQDHRGAMAAHLRAVTAMEGARAVSAGERWDREMEQIYVELLRAHAAVPGADPDIAARARLALKARRASRTPAVA